LEAFLGWLEGAALGQFVRGSGVWAYAILNLAHILGVATLFGSVLALDLRLLGLWRRVPLEALERPTVPLAVVGFVLAAASGTAMLSTNASEYGGNPFLLIKFGAIGAAALNLVVLQALPSWRARGAASLRGGRALAASGAISLLCWLTAVAAGRMIGYW
jgi:hypothetical protein